MNQEPQHKNAAIRVMSSHGLQWSEICAISEVQWLTESLDLTGNEYNQEDDGDDSDSKQGACDTRDARVTARLSL